MNVIRRGRVQLVTVIAFVVACVVFVGYLWTQAGGSIPFVASPRHGYTVSADFGNVQNMVPYADVDVAGVAVGKVVSVTRAGGSVRLAMSLDPSVAPLHEGATVQVTEKSLVGQPVVNLVDGHGAVVPDGAVLPASAVRPSVSLHDVLTSLDPHTRAALGSTLRSLGASTDGTSASITQLATGLGQLGNSGHDALDAISAQSRDLTDLARQLPVVLDALNSGNADLARLVDSGNALAQATSGQQSAVADAVRLLPGTLTSVRTATGQLTTLAGSLSPIAADLNAAAPGLNNALTTLPDVTARLNALLPALNGVLGKAPATLDRVPAVAADANLLLPRLRDRLRDLNPMLSYLSPYGHDIGSFVANFSASFAHTSSNGNNVLDLFAVVNDQSVRGNPLNLNGGVLVGSNPYPKPGQQSDLRPFTGNYPRLYQASE